MVNEDYEHLIQTHKGTAKKLKAVASGEGGARDLKALYCLLCYTTFMDDFDKSKKFCHANSSFLS